MKFRLVLQFIEVEWLSGSENNRLFRKITIRGIVQRICECISLDPELSKGSVPSIKSLVNIFTLRGRSLLLLSWSAVTMGNFSYSSALSKGHISVLCCQLVSWAPTPPLSLDEHLICCAWRRAWCIRKGSEECERRDWQDRWVNSCLNNRATIGESIHVTVHICMEVEELCCWKVDFEVVKAFSLQGCGEACFESAFAPVKHINV